MSAMNSAHNNTSIPEMEFAVALQDIKDSAAFKRYLQKVLAGNRRPW